jgi:hypothetical protein
MNRREALSNVALLLGGSIIGANVFLTGCKSKTDVLESGYVLPSFSAHDISFLDEVAETILPKTATPGAKDAKVGEFMTTIVNDCYSADEQKAFMNGMKELDAASKAKNKKSFMESDAKERHDLLVALDADAKDAQKNRRPTHYFRMMKELTLWGYFTSEVGAKQALRYVAVPGKYEGCIDYKKGDKAWAT